MNDQTETNVLNDVLKNSIYQEWSKAGGIEAGKIKESLASRVLQVNINTFKEKADQAKGPGAGSAGQLLAVFTVLEKIAADCTEEANTNRSKFIGETLTQEQTKVADKYAKLITSQENTLNQTIVAGINERLSALNIKYEPPKDETEAVLMREVRDCLRSLPDWQAKQEAWRTIVAEGDMLSMRAVFSAPCFMRKSLLGVSADIVLDSTRQDEIKRKSPEALENIALIQEGLRMVNDALQLARSTVFATTNIEFGPVRSKMTLEERASYVQENGTDTYLSLPY